jgi:hypothetical protein
MRPKNRSSAEATNVATAALDPKANVVTNHDLP